MKLMVRMKGSYIMLGKCMCLKANKRCNYMKELMQNSYRLRKARSLIGLPAYRYPYCIEGVCMLMLLQEGLMLKVSLLV